MKILRPRTSSVLLLLALAMVSGSSGAASIVVGTIQDAVAADGQCSLREALINANHTNQITSQQTFSASEPASGKARERGHSQFYFK
jgi:CSLREA domain-containing protein